jgi:hypothetical protein
MSFTNQPNQSGQSGHEYARGEVPFTNYVIAVLTTLEEAKATEEALRTRGFAPADIVLAAPLTPSTPESEREQGTLADPPTTAQGIFTEEGYHQEQYEAERWRGHVVIQVGTPDSKDVDRAHKVLVEHGAHRIMRVGALTRERLPED